jgi:hypothetical protein
MKMNPAAEALFLVLPLVVAGVGHLFVVRYDLLPALKIPVHKRLFGANKTLRGFVLMPILACIGLFFTVFLENHLFNFESHSVLQQAPPLPLGLSLGFAYVLFELPNSYLKRRLGIPPGKVLLRYRWLTYISDHVDSLIGCLIIYAFWVDISPVTALFVLIAAPLIHTFVNLVLYALGIRREAL